MLREWLTEAYSSAGLPSSQAVSKWTVSFPSESPCQKDGYKYGPNTLMQTGESYARLHIISSHNPRWPGALPHVDQHILPHNYSSCNGNSVYQIVLQKSLPIVEPITGASHVRRMGRIPTQVPTLGLHLVTIPYDGNPCSIKDGPYDKDKETSSSIRDVFDVGY